MPPISRHAREADETGKQIDALPFGFGPGVGVPGDVSSFFALGFVLSVMMNFA